MSNIAPESTSHYHACTDDDVREMIDLISCQKPFQHQPGRTLKSFPSISKSPLDQLDAFALHSWQTRNKKRLASNPYSCDDFSLEEGDTDGEEEEEEEEKKKKRRKLFFLMKKWMTRKMVIDTI